MKREQFTINKRRQQMKKRMLVVGLVLVVIAGAIALYTDIGVAQLGKKFSGLFRRVVVDDSIRVGGAATFNGTATFNAATSLNANLTGVDKLVVDDSLRVGKTSIFNGAMTLNGNLTGVDKVVVDDSLRVGKTSIFNGGSTFNDYVTVRNPVGGNTYSFRGMYPTSGANSFTADTAGNVAAEGKLVVDDSVRVPRLILSTTAVAAGDSTVGRIVFDGNVFRGWNGTQWDTLSR
jgi:predicted acyltransferase (DUF342 family)